MLKVKDGTIYLSGLWILPQLNEIDKAIHTLSSPQAIEIIIDGALLEKLDTSGAYRIVELIENLSSNGKSVVRQNFTDNNEKLLLLISERYSKRVHVQSPISRESEIAKIGRASRETIEQLITFVGFVGLVTKATIANLMKPWTLRWCSLWANVESGGVDAVPIVGLLNFLIGIVIAYQSASLLLQYGANIFIVEIVSVSMLREMAPLITAIIVAGRTGSAYAAQIGTMMINEEIDALRTIGINPIEQLVLPKMLAMLISLPLLVVFADIMSIGGGMLLANLFLDVTYIEFVDRIPQVLSASSLWVGLAKTPVFAIIISLTGCYQGFKVEGGADSVGKQTTKAVVQSIFLVIIADAIFSIITRNVGI